MHITLGKSYSGKSNDRVKFVTEQKGLEEPISIYLNKLGLKMANLQKKFMFFNSDRMGMLNILKSGKRDRRVRGRGKL